MSAVVSRSTSPLTRREALAREPFTLALSSGFFAFYAHAGFLAALEAAGLQPRRVVGVSAGALAGGLWSAGMKAHDIAQRLIALRREEFWDAGLPLGGLIKGQRFEALLREVVGHRPIQTLERPFAAVAYHLVRRRTVSLEGGQLTTAIRASCAVPLMFRPVWHERQLLVDGGVTDRIGVTSLAPGERTLLHYIPSSSRPHRQAAEQRAVERRPHTTALIAAGLPQVTPFHLQRGARAFSLAHERALQWLEEPVG